jgi:hypothetical protein
MGTLTVDALVSTIAWNDDNHLEQIARALARKP